MLALNSDVSEIVNSKTCDRLKISISGKMIDYDCSQRSYKQLNFQELILFQRYPLSGNDAGPRIEPLDENEFKNRASVR